MQQCLMATTTQEYEKDCPTPMKVFFILFLVINLPENPQYQFILEENNPD
jgi:hypothetical protein